MIIFMLLFFLVMDDFTKVLVELHQAYVQHMMSPGNKPGLCPYLLLVFSYNLLFCTAAFFPLLTAFSDGLCVCVKNATFKAEINFVLDMGWKRQTGFWICFVQQEFVSFLQFFSSLSSVTMKMHLFIYFSFVCLFVCFVHDLLNCYCWAKLFPKYFLSIWFTYIWIYVSSFKITLTTLRKRFCLHLVVESRIGLSCVHRYYQY